MSSRSPGSMYQSLDTHPDSPFTSEPLVASNSHAAAGWHNRHSSSSSSSPSSSRQPPLQGTVPLHSQRNRSLSPSSHAGAASTSSAIGQRSLMGILGGTRYEPRDVGFGFTVREEDEDQQSDEEEPDEPPDAYLFGRQEDAGAQTAHRHSNGAADRPVDLSKLPPPPSVSSDEGEDDREERDEDNDDDDPPPDLTEATPSTSPKLNQPSPSLSRNGRRSRPLNDSTPALGRGPIRLGGPEGLINQMGPRERALWRWVNVSDMDLFLQEVYAYYVGKGMWPMVLSRAVSLLTVAWVVSFSTFLGGCIDYSDIKNKHSLSDVVVDQCLSHFSASAMLLVLLAFGFFVHRLVNFGVSVKSLWAMHEFYEQLLEIPESDIQSISWGTLVNRLSSLRAAHPSAMGMNTGVFDAHDIANRIMREENYLIALFNKEILNLTLPLPMPAWTGRLQNGQLTKTLEWNLRFCLSSYFFDPKGQMRRAFLSERNRQDLALTLRKRFQLLAIMNAVLAPFIVLYLLVYSFFRYFEEYHKNPSTIGLRTFTPLARWQFREFNELPHLFNQRLNHAHPIAESYVAHFPRERTAVICRFVAFVAGSLAAVLILFSLIDPDAFLHFEITKDRTVLFWIGITGAIVAVARGMIPDDKQTGDPESLMSEIIEHTHYCPQDWRGRLHSAYVHIQFSQMFRMKIALFFEELGSVVLTPLVLWRSLPNSSLAIVDFFREFTIHVDGLGYVCSFAVFDFKRHGDTRFGAPVEADKRWRSNEGKMEKSFLNFTSQNPQWAPRDQAQSLFLSRMTESVAVHPVPFAGAASRIQHRSIPTSRPVPSSTAAAGDQHRDHVARQRAAARNRRQIVETSALDGEEYVDHHVQDRHLDIEDDMEQGPEMGPASLVRDLYKKL